MTLVSKGRREIRRAGRKKRRKEEREGEARGWGREGGRMDTQRQEKQTKRRTITSQETTAERENYINPFNSIFLGVLSRSSKLIFSWPWEIGT